MVRILLASSADLLALVAPHITVEAEYGSQVVEGYIYTAAHHGPPGTPYAGDHVEAGGRPCPCVDEGIPLLKSGVIGVSHIDLDTVGGCGRALGHAIVGQNPEFWATARHVDVKGPHRLHEIDPNPETVNQIQAYWAWSEQNRGPRLAHGKLHDVTEQVVEHLDTLARIFAGDEELIEAGQAWAAKKAQLETDSFVMEHNNVLFRESTSFVNSLYSHGDGVAKAILGYNPVTGAITVSLEAPIPGFSCRTFLQELLGPKAGGHDGIAGGDRARQYTREEAEEVFDKLVEALS